MSTRTLTTLIGLAFMMTACSGGDGGPTERVCAIVLGCSTAKISVYAGLDQSAVEGDTVELRGGTNSFKASKLSYQWQQLTGPSVTVFGSTQAMASFEAPSVSTTTTLTFRFTIKKSGKKSSDDVTVVVEPTSATALCLQAPLYAVSYAWTNSGCTTDGADIVGDSRVATLYRQSEAEPNDSVQAAASLIFPTPVSTEPPAADVIGSIDDASGDASDFFVFTPPGSGDYHVYLCNDPLACMRGTVTEDWFLELYDQNLTVIARTIPGKLTEQKVMLRLDAGLPYYVGVIDWGASARYWQYNLTIVRD